MIGMMKIASECNQLPLSGGFQIGGLLGPSFKGAIFFLQSLIDLHRSTPVISVVL